MGVLPKCNECVLLTTCTKTCIDPSSIEIVETLEEHLMFNRNCPCCNKGKIIKTEENNSIELTLSSAISQRCYNCMHEFITSYDSTTLYAVRKFNHD